MLKLAAQLLFVTKRKDRNAKISPWIPPPHLSWWPCWGWAAAARWSKTGNTPLTDHCSGTKMLRCRKKNTEPSSGWQTWWSLVNSAVHRESITNLFIVHIRNMADTVIFPDNHRPVIVKMCVDGGNWIVGVKGQHCSIEEGLPLWEYPLIMLF